MKTLLILLLAVSASAKRIPVTKSVDSSQLKAELADAGVEANLENCATGDASRCFVVCDNAASNATIAAVVAAHAPKIISTRAALLAEATALRVKIKDRSISDAEIDRLFEILKLYADAKP